MSDIDTAPVKLSSPQIEQSKEHSDLLEKFTQVSEKKAELEAEVETLRKINATNEILDTLIEPYAHRTFRFMWLYCLAVAAFLIASLCGRSLPGGVLQVLVGSTAVTVIGLVGMVLTGIFVGARRKL